MNTSQPKPLDKVPQTLLQSVSYRQQREDTVAMDQFSATVKGLLTMGPEEVAVSTVMESSVYHTNICASW